MFDSGLRHEKMPYLCGFADSMLQKVSKKVSTTKGGALELYSPNKKQDIERPVFLFLQTTKYVVKNAYFTAKISVKKGSTSFYTHASLIERCLLGVNNVRLHELDTLSIQKGLTWSRPHCHNIFQDP